MIQKTELDWPTCKQDGCIGIRPDSARMCLAHCSNGDRATALKLISETGTIDARGVLITDALLEQIMTVIPRGTDSKPLFRDSRFEKAIFAGNAGFNNATFTGYAGFGGATFTGYAGFGGATFTGYAGFGGATFTGYAGFDRATFTGNAGFIKATFTGGAGFDRAIFTGNAGFNGATFTGNAGFNGATFTGSAGFGGATFTCGAWFGGATFNDAGFKEATFTGDASFRGATFTSSARFGEATFRGDARFGEATFRGDAQFDGTRFEHARQFGPLLVNQALVLDGVQFAQPVQIKASTPRLSCRRARFPGGVQFYLRWASVVLDDTDLAAPSILAGGPHSTKSKVPGQEEEFARREEQMASSWKQKLAGSISERPQLLSLRGADVAGLGLSNISAAECRFVGAHNLDKLRLEPDVSFTTAPLPLSLAGQKWGGRQVIAEERAWRTGHPWRTEPTPLSGPGAESRRWGAAPWWPPWLDDQPGELDPGQIAGLYRALRKGREDVKDEPGAADFYYGEMEMRRHAGSLSTGNSAGQSSASPQGRVERGILTAYWLVSGYGLRAWRAIACLAGVAALLALAFYLVGFTVPPQPDSYWTSLLYAFRATLSLTDSDVKLTAWGQLLQGVLRLTGPVLLGLAVLALRGRLKR